MRLHFGFTAYSACLQGPPTMLLLLRHSLKLLLLATLLGACAQVFAAPPSRHPPQARGNNDHPQRSDDALSDSVRRIERSVGDLLRQASVRTQKSV